jgi:hypothetical protein
MSEIISQYSGRKRANYERAAENIKNQGYLQKWHELEVFVKAEPTEDGKPCRAICPRAAEYRLLLAQYLKPLEPVLCKALGVGCDSLCGGSTGVALAKGLNLAERGRVIAQKWACFKDPVCVGTDASALDAHTVQEALKYEHSFYNSVLRSKHLAWLLRKQLVNVGVAKCPDGKVRFRVKGRRASGDINTGLGNSILMLAVLVAYCYEFGLRVELFVDGDDAITIMERSTLQHFAKLGEFAEDLAFRMKIEEPVDELEKISFCQCSPVLLATGWTMVRNPERVLERDACSLKPMETAGQFDAWRGAVAMGGLAAYANVPILGAFYEYLGRGAELREPDVMRGFDYVRVGMDVRATPEITPKARASFFMAFDITPAHQLAIEAMYSSEPAPHFSKPNRVVKFTRQLQL